MNNSIRNIDYSSTQTLFGRSDEKADLQVAYDQTEDGPAAVFVSGCSGSGKSALVNTLKVEDGFFLRGTFDSFRQSGDCAHSALVDAFSGLSELSYSDDLKARLGPVLKHRSILAQIIPSLPTIHKYDRSSSIENKSATKTGWGFELLKIMLRDFMKHVCRDHTIVLFLDDLHNCDKSDLDIISTLINDPELINFLFVGAYRSDELDSNHHLYDCMEEFENRDGSTIISLKNLEIETCNELISDLINLEPEATEGLSTVVHKRTAGNPFFVVEFMQMLERSKLLWYSLSNAKWEFDLVRIEGETSLAINIISTVVGKIKDLPSIAQEVLKVAACLGSRFDPLMVGHLLRTMPKCESSSMPVDDEGINAILKQCTAEGLVVSFQRKLDASGTETFFRFTHDKIQQASYSLIPPNERSALHLTFGRILRDLLMESSEDLALLIVIGQLARERQSLLEDLNEQLDLVRLILKAAKKLRIKSAFFPASSLIDLGLDLLGKTQWKDNYDLCLEMVTVGAELDYCCGSGDRCQQRVKEILGEARSLQDKIRAYFILVDFHNIHGNNSEALSFGYGFLKLLGVKIRSYIGPLHVMYQFVSTTRLIGNRSDADLLSLAETTDEKVIATIKMMQSLISAAYGADRMNEFAYMVIIMMKLTIKKGMTIMSGAVFSSFGGICTAIGKLQLGNRFGLLGLELNKSIDDKRYRCKSMVQYYGFVFNIKNAYYLSLEPFLEAHKIGMEVGDLDHSSIATFCYVVVYYLSGLPLHAMDEDAKLFSMRMREYGQHQPLTLLKIYHQCALNLMGKAGAKPTRLEGDVITDIDRFLYSGGGGNSDSTKRPLQAHSNVSMQLAYYFRDSKLALKAAKDNQSFRDSEWPVFYSFVYPFFRALIWIEAARSHPRLYLRKARSCIRHMEAKTKQGMVNMHHMLLIAKAEFMSLKRKGSQFHDIKSAFDDAISASRRSGFTQNAALVNELAGRFMMRESDTEWAGFYLKRSIEQYGEWGAEAKVDQLKKEFHSAVLSSKEDRRSQNGSSHKGRSRFAETDRADKRGSCSNGLWPLSSSASDSGSSSEFF